MSVQSSPIIIPPAIPGGFEMRVRGGVIRCGQINAWGRPYWHVNSAHARVGIKGISDIDPSDMRVKLVNDRLVVEGDDVDPLEEIITIACNVDESLAQAGIRCGASGSEASNTIYLYNSAGVEISPRSTSYFPDDGFNVWYHEISVRSTA